MRPARVLANIKKINDENANTPNYVPLVVPAYKKLADWCLEYNLIPESTLHDLPFVVDYNNNTIVTTLRNKNK